MEEEDIKILENVIVEYSTQVEDYKYYTVPVRLDERDIEALENLLKAYRELEKENEELKKKYSCLINKIENKIDKFDYEFEKAKRKNGKDRADYYWDLIINFKKLLELKSEE